MTKADIVNFIAEGTGITKLETEAVVEGFLKAVGVALKNGNRIEIRGFGTFGVKKKAARWARNPKKGDRVFVNEHFAPTFKFSKEFKAAVNDELKSKG